MTPEERYSVRVPKVKTFVLPEGNDPELEAMSIALEVMDQLLCDADEDACSRVLRYLTHRFIPRAPK